MLSTLCKDDRFDNDNEQNDDQERLFVKARKAGDVVDRP